jgi:hypothetical protein
MTRTGTIIRSGGSGRTTPKSVKPFADYAKPGTLSEFAATVIDEF